MSTASEREVVRHNRDFWESIAGDRLGAPMEFFASGGSALEPYELDVIGDPAGLRVLHLAYAVGDESLTFATSGARVTAVDLSPTHLAHGRAKAAALGLDVDFREGDMTALDPDLVAFDLIYISGGGICWVPDIDRWAWTVHDRLSPGGRVIICEHHPLWETLSVTGDNRLAVTHDYFGGPRFGEPDRRKAPQVTHDRTDPLPEHHVFVWSIGRVVSAVIGAGMTLTSLQERDQPDMYPGLGAAAAHLPAGYLLVGQRSSPAGPPRPEVG